MLLGVDREYIVVEAFAPVFVQDVDEAVDKQRFGQFGEFRALVDNHAFLLVNHIPYQVDDIDVRHAAAVKAEEEEVEAELLLLGKEAAVHEFHAPDDVWIDRFGPLKNCVAVVCNAVFIVRQLKIEEIGYAFFIVGIF